MPYIKPAEYLVNYWGNYFKQLGAAKLKVGIAWQGNPDHQADHFRSVKLAMYKPLLECANVKFFSLQQGFGADQIQSERLEAVIHRFPKEQTNLVERSWILLQSCSI